MPADLDTFDFDLFPPVPAARCSSTAEPVAVRPSTRRAGPQGSNRDDAAVANHENRRACQARRSR